MRSRTALGREDFRTMVQLQAARQMFIRLRKLIAPYFSACRENAREL